MSSPAPPAPDQGEVLADVRRALKEDLGPGDVNTDLVIDRENRRARVICREPMVLAGTPWFDACFRELDSSVRVRWSFQDGDRVAANTVLCRLHGPAHALLRGERTALNFLQLLSGTATTTAEYVAVVADSPTIILDTRKTIPGLRLAQKHAVRCGGGQNHRMGLYDAILLKENHISAAGSIANAVQHARAAHPDLLLEIEVESLDELEQAMAANVDRVMLDEFNDADLCAALERTGNQVAVEVSGSIDLPRLRQLATLGIDYISIGALTKHVRAIDLSMRMDDP